MPAYDYRCNSCGRKSTLFYKSYKDYDAATAAAIDALARILAKPTPWTLRGRLEPGMGLVCNNVLHDRSGFTETAERRRLLYRARYHERVAETTVTAPA